MIGFTAWPFQFREVRDPFRRLFAGGKKSGCNVRLVLIEKQEALHSVIRILEFAGCHLAIDIFLNCGRNFDHHCCHTSPHFFSGTGTKSRINIPVVASFRCTTPSNPADATIGVFG